MNRNHFQISVPQPCSNRWEEMAHVSDRERHCASCDKVIVDFTEMSDAQVIAYFMKQGNTCGRFSPYQLDRDLLPPGERKRFSWKSAFLLPALLLWMQGAAQNKGPQSKPVRTVQADTARMKADFIAEQIRYNNDTILIHGKITDSLAQTNLAGAVLSFRTDMDTVDGIVTDYNGRFKVRLTGMRSDSTVEVTVRHAGYMVYSGVISVEPVPPPELPKKLILPTVVGGARASVVVAPPQRRRISWWFLDPRYW